MKIFRSLVLLFVFLTQKIAAAEFPQAIDLRWMGQQAATLNVPILMMVSQEHCSFCKTLMEEILQPMNISGDYTERVVMAELMMDEGINLKDWDGNDVAASQVAKRYGVWVTPTLLFLDPDGKVLHEAMLGVNTVEMYGYYIDEALDKALLRLRTEKRPQKIVNLLR